MVYLKSRPKIGKIWDKVPTGREGSFRVSSHTRFNFVDILMTNVLTSTGAQKEYFTFRGLVSLLSCKMFTIVSQKTGSSPVGNMSFILHFFGILPFQQFIKCILASPSCVYVYLFVLLFVYFLFRCVWISICLLSLFIFCGSSRLASLSTPGWLGWMGVYTALHFSAVFV